MLLLCTTAALCYLVTSVQIANAGCKDGLCMQLMIACGCGCVQGKGGAGCEMGRTILGLVFNKLLCGDTWIRTSIAGIPW